MWLKGSTDITNYQSDMYNLLTGAAAAGQRGSGQTGNGATVPAGDLWTGLDATNKVIRSQTGDSPFRGEYVLWRGIPRFAARATGTVMTPTATAQRGRPTFTGAYNNGGTNPRIYFAAFVSTNNSSPGSLTGTVITWTEVNADSGATVTSGTISGWSSSTDTKVIAHGVSLTLTLAGGESFVGGTNAIMWLRAYTSVFTDGVDYFPEGAKVTAAGLTVSNSSGGAANYTSGTDYALAQEQHTFPQESTTIGVLSHSKDFGGVGACSGIHWKTGGSPIAVGTTYYVPATYSIFNGYFHVGNLISSGGNYHITGGAMDFWDGTLQVGRWVQTTSDAYRTALNTSFSLGKLFTGVAQAGSTFINYWISVKVDKIVIVLRGDPGQSGLLMCMSFQRYIPLVTQDKVPWVMITDASSQTVSTGCAMAVTLKPVYDNPYWGDPAITVGTLLVPQYFGQVAATNNFSLVATGIGTEGTGTSAMPRQNPNNWDLRWWLYTIYLRLTHGGSNLAGTFDNSKTGGIRGKIRGLFALANDNFSSLDELADGANTYLLFAPATNFFNSSGIAYVVIAVLEE